ncbi:Chromatin assembly factor 1 subunit [Sorochytrium milnesiophthora]
MKIPTRTASIGVSGHQDEVSDLAWSPCGQYIASVGTDLKLRIWDYAKRETIGTAQDHTEFIQGVSWDPLGQYIATESVDRSLCVYSLAINTVDKSRRIASLKCVNKSYRMEQQQQQQQQQQGGGDESEPPQKMSRLSSSSAFGTRYMRLYCEPLTMSFFRRCSFSPDGSLLVAPAGQYRRFDPSTASTGADEGLSDSGVAEVLAPTTWMSCDGRTLVAPSHDGYCTVVSFDEHELGEPLPFEQYPNAVQEARQKQMSFLRAHDAAPIITAPEASTPSVPVSEVAAPPPTAATAAKKRIVPTFVSALQ